MGEGKRLQDYLKSRNIKITQLARESGISPNTLYATIKRDSSISAVTLGKLSKALGIETSELSEIISNNPKEKEAAFKPRILDSELEQTLLDTKELINKLNSLTREYEIALRRKNELNAMISDAEKRVYDLQMRILKNKSELDVVKTDIANRQLELEILRKKLYE